MSDFNITWAAARVNANMTQEEIANAMNVSKQTIINWEKYKTEPTISQAKMLCDIYKVPADVVRMDGAS